MVSSYTNFQGGVMSRGVPAEAGGLGTFSPFGNIYFVDSGHAAASADNSGKKPSAPLLTIDQAINKCTASQGDVIIVAAGHAETGVANATTIIPDVAGISIIGLGRGADRPTITFSNAAGNIPISAASIKLKNLLFTVSGTTDVTAGITVTGADCVLEDVELRDGGAAAQFAAGVVLGTGANRAKIINYIYRGHASGDANTAGISCAVAVDGVEIHNAWIDGLTSLGSVYNVTTAMTNLLINGGYFRSRHATQDAGINVVATTSGAIISPRLQSATNDADGFNKAIVADGMAVYDPLVVNLAGERGGAWGTASAAA